MSTAPCERAARTTEGDIVSGHQQTGRPQLGLSLLYLTSGLTVFWGLFTFASFIPEPFRSASQVLIPAAFLTTSLMFRRSRRWHGYWRSFFAFFVAAAAAALSTHSGEWGLWLSGLDFDSPNGFAVFKFSENVAIVLTIVVLTKLSGQDLGTIFFKWGKLRPGLAIGLGTFFFLSLLALQQPAARSLGPRQLLSLTPAILVIVLGDGLTEELLFRGLFLKKFGEFLGDKAANVVTAAVFALWHAQVGFGPPLPMFLLGAFVLGLIFGRIMQRTDSLLAPTLAHAAVDVLVILEALAAYGVIA